MLLQCFTVYDKAVKAFLTPFFVRSRGEAVRGFMEVCGDAQHAFAKHPTDYVLFYVGEFDDGSGLLSPTEPERLMGAYEVSVDAKPQLEVVKEVDRRPM